MCSAGVSQSINPPSFSLTGIGRISKTNVEDAGEYPSKRRRGDNLGMIRLVLCGIMGAARNTFLAPSARRCQPASPRASRGVRVVLYRCYRSRASRRLCMLRRQCAGVCKIAEPVAFVLDPCPIICTERRSECRGTPSPLRGMRTSRGCMGHDQPTRPTLLGGAVRHR